MKTLTAIITYRRAGMNWRTALSLALADVAGDCILENITTGRLL